MATTNAAIAAPEQQDVHRLKSGSLGLIGILLLAFSSAAPLVGCTGKYSPCSSVRQWRRRSCRIHRRHGGAALLRRRVRSHDQAAERYRRLLQFHQQRLEQAPRPRLGTVLDARISVRGSCRTGCHRLLRGRRTEQATGIKIPWLVIAGLALVLAAVASYFGVELSAKVLGVLFIFEIAILAIVNGAIFINGGPEGVSLEPVNPVNAFGGIAPGIGIFFAFWSWLGFEVVPNYAEEAKNPRKLVPLATYLAVLGIGLILFITAWATITGFGMGRVVEETTGQLGQSYISLAHTFVGPWAVDCINVLIITGCFASILALHQTVSRYIYAIAREGVLFPSKLGHTHSRYGSPHHAAVATFFGAALVLGLFTAFYFAAPSA
ncbi:APC family permease [Arthrobacter sp. K5]|uniref:APC family permease n=1 Tax=Arthrobacter sp. K5 TaxID=2839623 RepID=A0AAU8EW84_9MICC